MRNFAKILLSRWDDPDWRALSHTAQWLYDAMISSPNLSSCGVLEWRPKQVRTLCGAMPREVLDSALDELRERLYVVFDEEVDLLLVRSFIRNDDVVTNRNMMVNVVKSWRQCGSMPLKQIMVHELNRLRDDFPDQAIWAHDDMVKTLRTPPLDPQQFLEDTRDKVFF